MHAFTAAKNSTPQPDARWTQQQARSFSLVIAERTARPVYLIRNRDLAFRPPDEVLRSTGVKVIRTVPRSPMYNADAERFVRETRETLDNLILLGEQHHNQHCPHQGLGNGIPFGFGYPDQPAPLATVRREVALGGLLKLLCRAGGGLKPDAFLNTTRRLAH